MDAACILDLRTQDIIVLSAAIGQRRGARSSRSGDGEIHHANCAAISLRCASATSGTYPRDREVLHSAVKRVD